MSVASWAILLLSAALVVAGYGVAHFYSLARKLRASGAIDSKAVADLQQKLARKEAEADLLEQRRKDLEALRSREVKEMVEKKEAIDKVTGFEDFSFGEPNNLPLDPKDF